MCKSPKNISPLIHTYDKNSNRISATLNKVTTQSTLTKVVTPTNTIEYILNPLDQRVAKKVVLMTQSSAVFQTTPVVPSLQMQRNLHLLNALHLWADLTTLLATLDANNNIIQRYNYTDQRVPTSMQQNGETYYLHYDQVGTLKAISDINHNIVKEITYDTYGNILQDSNPNFKIPFGFAGGLYDQDTQLVHFGYREYDPYTGKWTTKDPIDFNGGDSNLYGYVLQDPVNFIDPLGLYDDPRFKRTLPNLGKPLISPDSTLGKITHGLGRDIPKAFKGFADGLKKLDNYADTCQDDSLSSNLFNYLYLNGQKSMNESETPINLIDKVSTYNTINDAASGGNE
jgi:RHS repeat-associated protein